MRRSPAEARARLGKLLTFYFCLWFPVLMWPWMVCLSFLMRFDPANYENNGMDIVMSCVFATGVETFMIYMSMMSIYNKLPLFPALQALGSFGATLFFLPWGLLHFTFLVASIFFAVTGYPTCGDECPVIRWVSWGGWCYVAVATTVQVSFLAALFVNMHRNGSIKGFITIIAQLFEKESPQIRSQRQGEDEAKDQGDEDGTAFSNPVHEGSRTVATQSS
jgi:hypothetical protein